MNRDICAEAAGPVGFSFIETAPRDGTFIRLRFRDGFGREDQEEVGHWQRHDHMRAGGAWFNKEGFYITPGPLFWAQTAALNSGPAS